MEQEIRYVEIAEGTVGYAVCGEGPTIVFGPRWVSHLEEEWNDPEIRSFFQEVGRTHTVVRFDRIGCGLSTRELQAPPTVEGESRQMEAVIRAVGAPVVVFATSCCGLSVSTLVIRAPELVEKIVFFGAYASRSDIPDATRQSVVEFTRTNWPLAAQMLMGLFDPHASGDEIARYARMQRTAASAEVAARRFWGRMSEWSVPSPSSTSRPRRASPRAPSRVSCATTGASPRRRPSASTAPSRSSATGRT
jgi:pimeloyl-ACP methyl ester carboxylesterase